jgi:hypothetical protein
MRTLTRSLIALAATTLFCSVAVAQPAATAPEKPTLGGTVHIVNVLQGEQIFAYVLRDVKTCAIESMLFLCGIQLEDNWLAGRRIMIPQSQISFMYEFESVDEYRESLKSARATVPRPPVR